MGRRPPGRGGAGLSPIEALRRAVDDGDDGALPILADALEDEGDTRAGGLRMMAPYKPWKDPWPEDPGRVHIWVEEEDDGRSYCYVKPRLFARLGGGHHFNGDEETLPFRAYTTRSEAYLDLAGALVSGGVGAPAPTP